MSANETYQIDLEFVIAQVLAHGWRHSKTLEDGTEVYAYPHPQGVAWGVNSAADGFNLRRGVRKADGTDIAVS